MTDAKGSATSVTLLERLRQNPRDEAAWEEFVGRYRPKIHGWCRDRGLQEALTTAANRATLVTSVDADNLGRFDTDVEAAVYFCCLEAMQNAGKHAGDNAIWRARRVRRSVWFSRLSVHRRDSDRR